MKAHVPFEEFILTFSNIKHDNYLRGRISRKQWLKQPASAYHILLDLGECLEEGEKMIDLQ